MNIGMLWFDNSKRTLEQKVLTAIDYFVKKHNKQPNLCLVNPSMFKGSEEIQFPITVRPYRPVLPLHLWIGVEEDETLN